HRRGAPLALRGPHRAVRLGKTASNLYFEVRAGMLRRRRDPSDNVARSQPYDDAVRVVENGGAIDWKAQGGGGGRAGVNCALELGRFQMPARGQVATVRCGADGWCGTVPRPGIGIGSASS